MTESNVDKQSGDVLCSMSKNWWTFILRGLLALVLAVVIFMMPAEALFTITMFFGGFALFDGVFSIVAAVRNIRHGSRWGWMAFRGVVGIITGIFVLISPFVATWVLAILLWSSIAVWSALGGAFELISAWRLRKEIHGEIWLMLSGLLSIILGVILMWLLFARPVEAFFAMGWVLGVYAAFLAAFQIMLGIRLRRNQAECATQNNGASAGEEQ